MRVMVTALFRPRESAEAFAQRRCSRAELAIYDAPVTHRVLRLSSTAWLAIGAGIALSSVVLFLTLAKGVAAEETHELDVAVLHWLAHHRSPVLTPFFLATTTLGSWPFVSFMTLVLCVGGVVRGWRRLSATLAAAVLGIPMLIVVLKPLYARPRPDAVEHLDFVDSASFPSGHALAASIFFGTIALMTARRVPSDVTRVLIATGGGLAIVLVALSRVYLGVHYPSDVLGGVLVGTTWSLLVLLASRMTEQRAVRA